MSFCSFCHNRPSSSLLRPPSYSGKTWFLRYESLKRTFPCFCRDIQQRSSCNIYTKGKKKKKSFTHTSKSKLNIIYHFTLTHTVVNTGNKLVVAVAEGVSPIISVFIFVFLSCVWSPSSGLHAVVLDINVINHSSM